MSMVMIIPAVPKEPLLVPRSRRCCSQRGHPGHLFNAIDENHQTGL